MGRMLGELAVTETILCERPHTLGAGSNEQPTRCLTPPPLPSLSPARPLLARCQPSLQPSLTLGALTGVHNSESLNARFTLQVTLLVSVAASKASPASGPAPAPLPSRPK